MNLPKILRKYLYGTAACAAVGAVLFFPGSVLMLAAGALLGLRGRAWAVKFFDDKEMSQ